MTILAGLSAALWAGCATVVTGSPLYVSDSRAELRGQVLTTVGGNVEYWVEYGRTPAYGSESEHSSNSFEAGVPRVTSALATGLTKGTTYHYRFCARDSQQSAGAPGCGLDRTFTTPSFACGETVTQSVRLTSTVLCPTMRALVIGAPGIDVNLGGHTLIGRIGNTAGHADATIRNGSLSGVELVGASRNRIRDVDVTFEISIEGGEANEIQSSTVGEGTAAVGSDRLVIADSTVNSTFEPAVAVSGDQARIVRNRLPVDATGFFSRRPSIELSGSDNRVVENGVGLGGPPTVFARSPEPGILLASGARNVIAENEVINVPAGSGADRLGDGIFVAAGTIGTLLRDNLARQNAGDGIEVQSPDARLRDNTANNNGDFGIDAAAGVTDLGGNSAFGNGNPLQCRNVFCL